MFTNGSRYRSTGGPIDSYAILRSARSDPGPSAASVAPSSACRCSRPRCFLSTGRSPGAQRGPSFRNRKRPWWFVGNRELRLFTYIYMIIHNYIIINYSICITYIITYIYIYIWFELIWDHQICHILCCFISRWNHCVRPWRPRLAWHRRPEFVPKNAILIDGLWCLSIGLWWLMLVKKMVRKKSKSWLSL